MTTLLSITYFGPVQWYQKLHRSERVLIERHESFVKQTYRNRCTIATTNGPQMLSLPTCHSSLASSITSTLVSNHGNWQHQHWNAIASAYGESAFFDYYADDLRPFFTEQWPSLFDFDMAITWKMCELLDISPNVEFTTEYVAAKDISLNHIADFREAIRPKNPPIDSSFQPKKYYQVYAAKHGFMPNMSILDLLMNMGNEAIYYL